MDQAAKEVTAADPAEVDHFGHRSLAAGRLAERWPLPEGAVRPVLVMVLGVARENVLQVPAADDQEPVQAFAADASDPALGVRAPTHPAGAWP